MKKVFVLLLAVLLMLPTGCSQTVPASGSVEQPDEWGIVLSAEDVTPTGMTLVCTQSGGNAKGELQTGSPFVLERFVAGEWLPVGIKPGLDVAWTMEGWMIERDAQTKWKVDWEFLYGRLESDTYRISKVIMDFRSPGKYTEKTYCAEFGVVD